MPVTKHFKSNASYHKFLAYEHIHHVVPKHGPYTSVLIAGHKHRVKHERR